MNVVEVEYSETLECDGLSQSAYAGDVVLIKNFLPEKEVLKFREELIGWKNSSTAYTNQNPYPEDLLNFHTPLINQSVEREDGSLDYHENYTGFRMYNYRIGDRHAEEIKLKMPSLDSLAPKIFSLFYKILKKNELTHGKKDPHNLYLEVVNFPAKGGIVEPHTHESILRYGQPINMVVALSRRGIDFSEGGLQIESKSKETHDLTNRFCFGDAIFFRNDLVHWVTPVKGSKPEHFLENGGRWSLTMFYY